MHKLTQLSGVSALNQRKLLKNYFLWATKKNPTKQKIFIAF